MYYLHTQLRVCLLVVGEREIDGHTDRHSETEVTADRDRERSFKFKASVRTDGSKQHNQT